MSFESFELQGHDDDGHYVNSYIEFMQNNDNYDDSYDKKKEKHKKTQPNLEEFIE